MTGAYLRVRREEGFCPVEVEYMTIEERQEHFQGRSNAELLRWMDVLCAKLVEAEATLNGLVRDGVLEKR